MLKRFKLWGVVLGLSWLAGWSMGQSIRPGWGATPYADAAGTGVTFRVWAPNAATVNVFGPFNGWNTNATPLIREVPLTNGIWSVDVPQAEVGQEYKYSINDSIRRRDPRARQVIHSGEAAAIIYDPDAYRWNTPEFIPPPLDDLIIHELHIGTLNHPNPTASEVGTFHQAIERLDDVALLGVNAIHLMPVAEFAGNNSWGYNPSDPFAVESAYGGPDGLKAFVDAAHARGLAVLLDVVHNHYGPGDLENSLWQFDGWAGPEGGGIYFYQDAARASTPWGPRPDYSRPQVRNYIEDNIRMWIEEYRIDGFRWDATLFMRFDTNFTPIADGELLLRDISEMMEAEFPEKIRIAEDLLGDERLTAPLSLTNSLGFNSQWDRSFHEILTAQLISDISRNVEVIADLMTYTGGTRRVIYTESHDEVGYLNADEGAVRFTTQISASDPFGYIARKKSTMGAVFALTAPGIPMLFQGQEMLENELFSTTNAVDWVKTNTYSGIVRLYQDAIGLRRNRGGATEGLRGTVSSATVTNDGSMLLVRRGFEGRPEDDVLIIANLSTNFVEGYWIDFPPADGTWYTHFNSDHADYSPDYGSWGSEEVFVWPDFRGNPYLAPWSVIVLSRHPPPPLDSDRDGMPDAWETANGLDPTNPRDAWLNPDHDSATNLEEFRAGTDPNLWNLPASDYAMIALAGDFNGWNTSADPMVRIADGLWQRDLTLSAATISFKFAANDGWDDNWGVELQSHATPPLTLPLAPASIDNIVLTNLTPGIYRFQFDETLARFTVRRVPVADSDVDGMPDAWELTNGLNPLSSHDRHLNPDGDLYTNLEEYWNDNNPSIWNPPLTDYASMTVGGSFNQWNLAAANMIQDTNQHYTWILVTNLVLRDGIDFKFFADGSSSIDWGDHNPDHADWPLHGIADFKGSDIAIQQGFNGNYRFTFNEQTLTYSLVLDDPDTDGDGLPNWWESLHFSGPTSADPHGNADGDIYTNREEYLNNTDPNVWTSPDANYAAMAVAGTFNGWNTAPNMQLVDHHVWQYTHAFSQASGVEFKFAANGNWNANWGRNMTAPIPLQQTANWRQDANIRIDGTVQGIVVFRFNDETREFSVAYDTSGITLGLNPGSPTAGAPVVIRWNSEDGETYQVRRLHDLRTPEIYTLLAPGVAATPPENVFTDAAPTSVSGFYHVLIVP